MPNRLRLGFVDLQLPVDGIVAERHRSPIHMPFFLEAAILSRIDGAAHLAGLGVAHALAVSVRPRHGSLPRAGRRRRGRCGWCR
jgi:hypothetical protein